MKTHPPLAILLAAAVIQLQTHCLIQGLSDGRDDASGEIKTTTTTCEPRELAIRGRVISSSCDSLYQIATLSSSPRRCMHIEASSRPRADDVDAHAPEICTNFPNWFDGTNGCDAYGQNDGWCGEYGDYAYESTNRPANEACCACGGGVRSKPRLMVGDYVKLKHHVLEQCKSLRIVHIETANHPFTYVVEVMKSCGPMGYMMDANGHVNMVQQFQAGARVNIPTDDPNVISKRIKVMLKKCRRGMPEQEFEVVPVVAGADDENGTNGMVVIRHPLSGNHLSSALDTKSSDILNITQVFEDGLFEGSSDYYFLKINVIEEGHHSYYYLASGRFGEKEYSE